MKLCGFLSPDGIYTPCSPYGHMDMAMEIAKKYHNRTFRSRLDGEMFLKEQGYVVFYAKGAHKRFVHNKKIMTLTREQEDFLILHMADANGEDQRWDMEHILRQNDDFKQDSAMDYVSGKFLKR